MSPETKTDVGIPVTGIRKKRVKGAAYLVTEGTRLGGEHTVEETGVVLPSCAPDIC